MPSWSSSRETDLSHSSGDGSRSAREEALRDFAARFAAPRRTPSVDRQIIELADQLDDRAVPFLILKGPALARVLYRVDEARGYIDADVLVAPAILDDARECLARLGYVRSAVRGIDDFMGLLHSEEWYRHEPDGALVDLHWRLAGCGGDPETVWTALDGSRQSIEIGGRALPVPGDSALAMHTAIHAAHHGPGDLKARADLARAVERWPLETWSSAARLAATVDATEPISAGLRTLEQGEQLASALDLPETPELTWAIEHRDERPRGTFHLDGLLSTRGVRARADVIRRSLFPTRDWIVWSYPWASGGPLRLAAGYARHLARSPVWAIRAFKYKRAAQKRGA